MQAVDQLIEEAKQLVEQYRNRGLAIDAAAARIRLKALEDAKKALLEGGVWSR